MLGQDEEKVPKVFISYSHDSPMHKRWVAEIASKLVGNGVDVILDQWELGLGDDAPKFMEKSVTESDRVLMICTETYVAKADEGRGGVGYEAMIVTGELIRDLGTSKFIPIIRQTSYPHILPKALSTRIYVNLSEGQNHVEQFETLLRELHRAPAIRKPSLGKNPFAKQPSGVEIPEKMDGRQAIPDIGQYKNKDILKVYLAALDIARQGDLVAWRKIVRQSKESIQQELANWREKYEPNLPREINAMQGVALEGMSPYCAVISIAIAGIESGREKFANQIALIDEILNPRDWNQAGKVIIVAFPESMAFVYQALYGAICVQTNQLPLALRLARAKVSLPMKDASEILYRSHSIVGWPTTLGGNSSGAYKFLAALPTEWKWLTQIFGQQTEYREALCSYYMALNLIEFSDTLAEGRQKILEEPEIMLDIPLSFLEEDHEITRRAYRLLINDPDAIISFWRSLKVDFGMVKQYWPSWIRHLKYWLARSREFGIPRHFYIAHENMISDL